MPTNRVPLIERVEAALGALPTDAWATSRELAEQLGANKGSVDTAICRLRNLGRLETSRLTDGAKVLGSRHRLVVHDHGPDMTPLQALVALRKLVRALEDARVLGERTILAGEAAEYHRALCMVDARAHELTSGRAAA